jgi:L-aminopeptidase/D-esterase-like protein
MITDLAGVLVGHRTLPGIGTGCTVVILPPGTIASGEVRGGAPATREFELLAPHRTVRTVDAVVLAGGSAFGLAAADGVMRWLAEQGRGFPTAAGPVPIVVAMALFDLAEGSHRGRPDAGDGYAAASAARPGPYETGRVGAATGATIAKWQGRDQRRPGAVVSHTVRDGELLVSALLAVNAWGDVDDGRDHRWPPPAPPAATYGANTTIGIVVTNARLDPDGAYVVAQGGHDGMARALSPTHTTVDGDALVATSVGPLEVPLDQVRHRAGQAVERALRSLAA